MADKFGKNQSNKRKASDFERDEHQSQSVLDFLSRENTVTNHPNSPVKDIEKQNERKRKTPKNLTFEKTRDSAANPSPIQGGKEKKNHEPEEETEEPEDIIDLRNTTLMDRKVLWNSIIREILFQVPCTCVWKCDAEGENESEIVTFDHLEGQRLLTVGKLMMPADMFTVMSFVQNLIAHVRYSAVIMSSKKLIHPALPPPDKAGSQFFYHIM